MHFYLRHVISVSFHRITVLKIKDNEVLENSIKWQTSLWKPSYVVWNWKKTNFSVFLAKRIETLSAVKSKPFSYKIDVNRNARLHWKSLMWRSNVKTTPNVNYALNSSRATKSPVWPFMLARAAGTHCTAFDNVLCILGGPMHVYGSYFLLPVHAYIPTHILYMWLDTFDCDVRAWQSKLSYRFLSAFITRKIAQINWK